MLFDAGLDEGHLRDPARPKSLFLDPGWDPHPVLRPEHEMGRQLATLGLGFGDISRVVLSRLHADHTGHLERMPQARLTLQRAEWEHATSGRQAASWFLEDYDLHGLAWELIEGDREIMPWMTALATPGHTPGHQSLLLDLPQTGRVLLAADVGDLMRNFQDEVLPGEASDDAQALASIRCVNALVMQGAKLLLTHDPDQLRAIRRAPGVCG